MRHHTQATPIVIVGGGLAGLAAATFLARAGLHVRLYDKTGALGGRARTETQHGFHFNLGPHALYGAGRAVQVPKELGVAFSGGMPSQAGGYVIDCGVPHTLPAGVVSLLTSDLFGLAAKLEMARWLANVGTMDTQALQHVTVRQWLERDVRQPDARRLIAMFLRVATYANDVERQSAGAVAVSAGRQCVVCRRRLADARQRFTRRGDTGWCGDHHGRQGDDDRARWAGARRAPGGWYALRRAGSHCGGESCRCQRARRGWRAYAARRLGTGGHSGAGSLFGGCLTALATAPGACRFWHGLSTLLLRAFRRGAARSCRRCPDTHGKVSWCDSSRGCEVGRASWKGCSIACSLAGATSWWRATSCRR